MRIRPAERTDVSELARLWIEFGAYYAELDPERFKTPVADWALLRGAEVVRKRL